MPMNFLLTHQSLMTLQIIVDIHMAMYGRDEYNPFCFTLNFKTSDIYLGKSVTTVKYPIP